MCNSHNCTHHNPPQSLPTPAKIKVGGKPFTLNSLRSDGGNPALAGGVSNGGEPSLVTKGYYADKSASKSASKPMFSYDSDMPTYREEEIRKAQNSITIPPILTKAKKKTLHLALASTPDFFGVKNETGELNESAVERVFKSDYVCEMVASRYKKKGLKIETKEEEERFQEDVKDQIKRDLTLSSRLMVQDILRSLFGSKTYTKQGLDSQGNKVTYEKQYEHKFCACCRLPKKKNPKIDEEEHSVAIFLDEETGKTGLGGLQTCQNYWVCPVCGARRSAENAKDVNNAVTNFMAYRDCEIGYLKNGGSLEGLEAFMVEQKKRFRIVAFVTCTFPHRLKDSLKKSLNDGLKVAIGELWKGSKDRKGSLHHCLSKHGYIGKVEVTEIKTGFVNGWHPHSHSILFFDGVDVDGLMGVENAVEHYSRAEIEERFFESIEKEIFERWRKACKKAGLLEPNAKYGVKVVSGSNAVKYVTKQGEDMGNVANYVLKEMIDSGKVIKKHSSRALEMTGSQNKGFFVNTTTSNIEDKIKNLSLKEWGGFNFFDLLFLSTVLDRNTADGKRVLHWIDEYVECTKNLRSIKFSGGLKDLLCFDYKQEKEKILVDLKSEKQNSELAEEAEPQEEELAPSLKNIVLRVIPKVLWKLSCREFGGRGKVIRCALVDYYNGVNTLNAYLYSLVKKRIEYLFSLKDIDVLLEIQTLKTTYRLFASPKMKEQENKKYLLKEERRRINREKSLSSPTPVLCGASAKHKESVLSNEDFERESMLNVFSNAEKLRKLKEEELKNQERRQINRENSLLRPTPVLGNVKGQSFLGSSDFCKVPTKKPL